MPAPTMGVCIGQLWDDIYLYEGGVVPASVPILRMNQRIQCITQRHLVTREDLSENLETDVLDAEVDLKP